MVLADPDRCAGVLVLEECLAKMSVKINERCNVTLTPNMPVASDGAYCKPSQGQLQYGELVGG